MSGLDFIVTGGQPDTSLTVAPTIDRILANGSLVLIDPIHSYSPMSAGIASGQTIPNMAWQQAAAMIGSGTQSSLAATFGVGAGNNAGSVAMDRSSKGGINVIMSQVGNTGSGVTAQGAKIVLPAAIKTYLAANPNHAYYVSRWIKRTRAAVTPSPPSEGSIYTNGASASGNSLFEIKPDTVAGTLSASDVDPALNSVADQFVALATSSWAGTDPGTLSADAYPVAWGQTIGSYQSAGFNNKSASYVFYRFYMEDLTVSGRTYDEVHAIDKAFWQSDMATGGRYAGDTFTSPSTLP